MSDRRYFALYAEVSNLVLPAEFEGTEADRLANFRVRNQYIVLPKRVGDVNHAVFTRVQYNREQKRQWHWGHFTTASAALVDLQQSASAWGQNAHVNPPLVIEVTEAELDLYLGVDGKAKARPNTPYKVIERVERSAPKHGYKF